MINNIIDVKRVELNATEPLSLDEAKAHLIITFTDDDDYVTSLISQCRRAVENYCNISMVTKTITLTGDLWNQVELPYGPVTSITSVKTREGISGSGPAQYTTDASNWQTDGEEFLVFLPNSFGFGNEPGVEYANQWMRPEKYGWGGWWNRIRIVYEAGPFTPDDLILAILNEMAFRYENRGEANEIRPTIAAQQGICPEARVLADPYVRQQWQ